MASFAQLTDEQRANLARVAHKMFHNPDVSREAKRLLMKADPTVKFPEIETEDLVEKKTESMQKKIDELQQQQIEANARTELARKHDLARARGLDPAEVEKNFMEKKIYDWDVAMQFTEMLHQSAAPTPDAINGGGNSTQMPTEADEKELWADPAKWASKQAHAAIDELNARRKQRAR